MKSDQTIIRKILMEQLNLITKLLDIKDPNIQFVDVVNRYTHKEIIAKLDYEAPSCPDYEKASPEVVSFWWCFSFILLSDKSS